MLIANVFGIFLFLFLLWKRLKDDYNYEKIFNLGLFILSGFLLGFLISFNLSPSFWFWIETLGIGLGFTFGIYKLKIKFFESFDGLSIGLLAWLGVYFLASTVINTDISSFFAFWVSAMSVFTFFFLDSHYKNFTWYESGRVGFSGISTVAIFFLTRALLSLFFPQEISMVGKLDVYLSSTVAFCFFLVLYKIIRAKK